ncbi:hypothetical protein D9K79_03705 [Acinetobacter cumulans]|uniref:Transport of long-chain fatty acid n=1 Tax=Acinetobacter cumulans TaxID=2136182 RepID=A0ABX9U901_9GAMM|nr:outer membrane protein transport protein [Acinetobacter cumulans]RLL49083.1 hypothetical protein D9K79_03705 [Acinetobacter cumulans]
MKPASMLALLPLCIACHTQAATLKRSGQSTLAFLEPNNYTEFNFGVVTGNLSGENSNKEELSQVLNVTDFSTGNLIEDFHFVQSAIKLQLNPQVSVGLLLDQPFGVKLNYDYSPESILGHEQLEAIDIHLKSENIAALMGYQPTPQWNIYGGLAYQNFGGDLNLFGQSFYFFNGYNVTLKNDRALGWLGGISYQIPEIALRANLTYRSRIKHKNQAIESTAMHGDFSDHTEIVTPQSVNFDFMSGITTHNLIYGSVRWVDWSNFKIKPKGFDQIIQNTISDSKALTPTPEISAFIQALANFNLIDYQSDQWSAKIGIAHQLNARTFASLETVWDSGSDNPASTINPANGYNGLGTGLRYQFSSKSFISGGLYYLKFKPSRQDKDSISVSSISTLDDRTAWAYGLKIGHFF